MSHLQSPRKLHLSVVEGESLDPRTLEPKARLHRALVGLNAVIVRQGHEVAKFRQSIGELKTSINELKDTVRRYQTKLKRIDVKPLRRRSLRLAAIMDRAIDDGAARSPKPSSCSGLPRT